MENILPEPYITTIKQISSGYLVNNNISVPNEPLNKDYQAVQRAINGTDEYKDNPIVPSPEFTDEEIKQNKLNAITNAIQQMLDKKAQELRYDNMMSARSYVGYTNAFQTEASKLADWCSSCWTTAGTIEADVKAGTRDIPTIDQVLSEMPTYTE